MESTQDTLISVETDAIATNLNTVFKAFDFEPHTGLLAYASANLVCLLDQSQEHPRVLFTLNEHKDRVNAVRWLNSKQIVSISADKSVIVWACEDDGGEREFAKWKVQQKFEKAHEQAINYLSVLRLGEESYFATMCMGGTLKLWAKKEEEYKLYGEILFGKNLQEALEMTPVGKKYLLLVVGGYDRNVHCYTCLRSGFQTGDSAPQNAFTYKFSLTGHKDSLKDFSFTGQKFSISNEVQYLASCSQDHNIRIWKVQPLSNVQKELHTNEDEIEETVKQYQSKTSYVLDLSDDQEQLYNIALESVLVQHAEAVSSVEWALSDSKYFESERSTDSVSGLSDIWLLSSSFDFTVCVWQADTDTQQWSVISTLGAMTGNKHAYFGAQFLDLVQDAKTERQIFAYTYGGAVHRWGRPNQDESEQQWKAKLTVKGHFGEVTDLCWDPSSKSCLVSCSSDQTTRLITKFGPREAETNTYYEISRPQVHGYDINSITCLKNQSQNTGDDQQYPFKILSGGDEKVIRLFDAPYNFVKRFNHLSHEVATGTVPSMRFRTDIDNTEVEKLLGEREESAKKQPLGLMNKPQILLANKGTRVNEAETGGQNEDFDPTNQLGARVLSNTVKDAEVVQRITSPPVEEILMSRTLWPESQKLYGHAFEIFCLAASNKGDCAASACKAKQEKYADIIIWQIIQNSVESEQQQSSVPICKLQGFQHLTVVQMEFSKNDMVLLACTRDRQVLLFRRASPEGFVFNLEKRVAEAHVRVIWALGWSHDDALFATASREPKKSVKIWNGLSSDAAALGTLNSELPSGQVPSATSLQFFPEQVVLPQSTAAAYAIMVGQESGALSIWVQKADQWQALYKVEKYRMHGLTVRRIRFGQVQQKENSKKYTVATCGNDHTVRIFGIHI